LFVEGVEAGVLGRGEDRKKHGRKKKDVTAKTQGGLRCGWGRRNEVGDGKGSSQGVKERISMDGGKKKPAEKRKVRSTKKTKGKPLSKNGGRQREKRKSLR